MGRVSRIGLDLDNTVIDYTPAYRVTAEKMRLPEGLLDRESIRPLLRRSEDDDIEWQRFQSLLYTDGLASAQPAAGLLDFLNLCVTWNIRVFIVSHKTSQTPVQFGARDLRAPALEWLLKQGIAPGFVREEDVYFCRTREEKVQRISALGCQVFVDDLMEVLDHPDLPADITRFHFLLDASTVSEVQAGIQSANFTSLAAWLTSC
jgi:hypothetical protein